MASPSNPDKSSYSSLDGESKRGGVVVSGSRFQKTVCLTDWWLLKSENDFQGGGLAVAGLTSREQQAMRVFSSAPILKSFDMFTLETTDGICVVIKGFINKARTTENGFPADVFNHFVLGFPSYWKEYAKNSLGTMAGGHSHVGSYVSDVKSPNKMDAKDMNKGRKAKSSSAVLPSNSDSVVRGIEECTPICCIAPASLDKKFYSKTSTITDQLTVGIPVNCFREKSLRTSVVVDKYVNDTHYHDSGGILSACRVYNENRGTKASEYLRKMRLDKNNSVSSRFDEVMRSRDGITSQRKDAPTRGENVQIPAPRSGYRTRSNSVLTVDSAKLHQSSVNVGPGGKTAVGKEPSDIMNVSKIDVGDVNAKCDITSEPLNQDKEQGIVENKRKTEKAKEKITRSHCWHSAGDNKQEQIVANQNCLSKKDEMTEMKTRRKLSYAETPQERKKKVLNGSPQSLNLNRSRSGRLLMPILKFWFNERAFYDPDGTITGIMSETLPEHPISGKKCTSTVKRR